MAKVNAGYRIIVLVLLIGILFLGGLLWFDHLGLVDVRERLNPVFRLLGMETPEQVPDDGSVLLLDEARLEKLWEELDRRETALLEQEEQLDIREEEIVQKLEALEEREKALEDREKSFNEIVKQYENKSANLRQAAEYFAGMPPEAAVERLVAMDDQDVIDILRMTEQMAREAGNVSVVSYWLSLMPADRAAVLNRKMLKKPEVQGG
ncbi:periplasmic-type flagellar collar protein FlbB [Marispirochaeta aestuarii]|uniref:Flagellar protein FlbB n=1 Tax=Marispirochaeta aestuarii TaxID=1963862 RepID=A0A1Y1RX82_9SPIO|nr:flagellar protein FlbB [Marispirochaeta aestuarii]ORC34274.1 flagellar protein FlbB [Marispirochaeta aestuarii]